MMSPPLQRLEHVFAANLGHETPPDLIRGLEPALEELVAACRQAWPNVGLAPELFIAHLAARTPADSTPLDWVRAAHAADLYIAGACLVGPPNADQALRELEARYGAEIDRALRGIRGRGLDDDARQILRQRLFVAPPGGVAKIATYSGRGPLRRWLRVAASRLMLELVGTREQPADEWELAALPVAGDDPEVAYLKARYRTEFKQAFADALGRLTPRERTLLAQYHVDALTIDELGALYGIHRVTAARWVAKAQARVREQVLALLDERLGLSSVSLQSVTRLIRSHLTLSLERALGSEAEGSRPR